MTPNEPRDRERMHHLMMAALDGEIEPEERRELDEELAADAALRKEWESMSRVKDVTSEIALAEPPAEIWDDYWEDVVRRFRDPSIGDWIRLMHGALRRKARCEAAAEDVGPVRTEDMIHEVDRFRRVRQRLPRTTAGTYV